MASQKEEPNASHLFGDSTGDDPFSQFQQPAAVSGQQPKPVNTTAQPVQQNNAAVGDASSLFGDSSKGDADLFFSSAAPTQQHPQQPQQQQQAHQQTAANASAAAFFDQPTQSDSFFDGLGQGNEGVASLTQAYDPNAYAYDYNTQSTTQQQQQQVAGDQQQAQEYDQSQWIQFDPNQHYYYDEQGQVHYYDPNTNQEYDMSQYGYGQDGQTYDYQYDPQYAEYYAQQGYDPNAYATDPQQQQQQQQYDPNAYATEQQQQYDPNAYATEQQQPQRQQAADGSYYDYSNQAYAPVTDAVAEVPAQIQSEQTIGNVQYAPQEDYGVQQNYTPADASTEPQQESLVQPQQQEFNYGASSTENVPEVSTQSTTNAIDDIFAQDNSQFSVNQLQNEFVAEDLQQQPQQQQHQAPVTSFPPPPPAATATTTATAVPPPPMSASAPPRSAAPPKATPAPQPEKVDAIPPPPKDIDIVAPVESRKSSFDVNASVAAEKKVEEELLDDLDDLVLGGSDSKSNQQLAADEIDHLVSTADYDRKPDPIYTNPNAYEEEDKQPEQIVPSSQNEHAPKAPEVAPPVEEAKQPVEANVLKVEGGEQAEHVSSYEPQQESEQKEQSTEQTSYEPQQPVESAVDYNSYTTQQNEQTVDYSQYSAQQGEETVDYNTYAPQQVEQEVSYGSYEPQQGDQTVDYSSYAPQQGEQAVDYSSYAPQQGEQTVDYSSYAPQEGEQAVDYNSYAPQQDANYSAYAPQQDQQTVAHGADKSKHDEQAVNYDLQTSQQSQEVHDFSSYIPQETEQTFDYSSYAPQEQNNTLNAAQAQADSKPVSAYDPPKSREVGSNYAPVEQTLPTPSAPPQQAVDYSPYAPQQQQQAETKPSAPADYSPYAPQQNAPAQQDTSYPPYAPPPQKPVNNAPPSNLSGPPSRRASNNSFTAPPPAASGPPRQAGVSSPPPRRNMISPPPANAIYGYPQRQNSITEPECRQSPVSFGYYNNQIPLERSATVPPPITDRIASPRPQLVPCPDPNCEGENKVKAKFCCECGRPLAGISRSTTPSVTMSPGFGNDGFSPMSASFAPVVERSAVDIKKDAMISSLKTFIAASPLINADQQLALNYIDSRIGEFDENKALLWSVVRAMIQHQGSALGDGGELDKSIVALLSTYTDDSSVGLDHLEHLLLKGDREVATQYAIENDMWGHALIISQSSGADHFKRVISQFIDRELFASTNELRPQLPSDKKSLRMLYSIFSGAGADAVLELARYSPQDHPLHCTADGLQSEWKRSLALVLTNRSSNDNDAITGLGNQLLQSGFVHAAYICFVLSSSLESQQIVGAQDTDIYTDLDALYLTELYEYASKSKHDTYKFIQAWWLTELGFTNEAKIYSDAITSTTELDKLSDICNTATSDSVTSLLKRATFDTLIGSISNNQGSYDAAAVATSGAYNYGYGYGGGYTAPADEGVQPKGIQSPFQIAASAPKTSPFGHSPSVPQTSPFQVASPQGAVRSPFGGAGGYAAPATTDSGSGGWWGSEEPAAAETEDTQQDYSQQQTESSYQPDAYTPAAATTTTTNTATYDDDDDDLGFGNPKKKPAKVEAETKEAEKPTEQKPNEITKEDKKEAEKGGWGIFSLFGRKEKDPNSDEKKAVKANLGEQSSFYYDEKEKRWVNKLNDTKPAAATPPPPPKAATPNPSSGSAAAPPMSNTPPMMGGPPMGGLKPASTPPMRTSSTPNVLGSSSGGPPSAAPPTFNTPPTSRRAGGARKPMRSRYVDVLNTPPPS